MLPGLFEESVASHEAQEAVQHKEGTVQPFTMWQHNEHGGNKAITSQKNFGNGSEVGEGCSFIVRQYQLQTLNNTGKRNPTCHPAG